MHKAVKWILSIIGVVVILIGGGLAYLYFTLNSSGSFANLVIEKGTVQYNIDGGEWKNAVNGMVLKEGYALKTDIGSRATVILSNSVTRMDENTTLSLDSLTPQKVSITQTIGRTWTNLLKLSGIKEYDLNTPNAIASVRGTIFTCTYDGESTKCEQIQSQMEFSSNGTVKTLQPGEALELKAGEFIQTSVDLNDSWIVENGLLDSKYKDQLKSCLEKRYSLAINTALSQNLVSQDQLNAFFDDWFAGRIKIADYMDQIPAQIRSMIKNPEDLGNFCVLK